MADDFTRIESYEAEEIAASLLGIACEEVDSDVIEEKLAETYGISMDDFESILQNVFGMLNLAISPITNTPMIGFGNQGQWFAKKEIPHKFINCVLHWMCEGDLKCTEGKGIMREIIGGDGKVEYILTMRKATEADQPKS